MKKIPKEVRITFCDWIKLNETENEFNDWILNYNIFSLFTRNKSILKIINKKHDLKYLRLIDMDSCENLNQIFFSETQIHAIEIKFMNTVSR